MAIEDVYKTNYETLIRAIGNGDTVLIECTDKKTGQPVVVLCAIDTEDNGDVSFVPLAKMFNDNPYEEVDLPDVDDTGIEHDAIMKAAVSRKGLDG